MKRTFSLVLAILCVFTLSFSSVFASQNTNANDKDFTIKATVEHGTIAPTNAKVAKGGSQTITYSADKGYQLKSVVVDDKAQDITKYSKNYSFSKVESNHTIAVAYEKPPALAYQRNANKASMKAGDKVTYTVKVSQTAKDAEARNVIMTDVLPEGLTLDKDSIKGDVKKLEANDNECKVQIDSLKDSVTYSYTATASKDIEDGKVLGKMSMKADNLKAYSGTSTAVEKPEANTPKDKEDSDTPGKEDENNQQGGTNQQDATTPGTNTASESDQQSQSGDNQSALTQVEMMKTVSNATPATGDTVTYTITVKKPQGDTNVKNITVTDQIPAGVEIDVSSIKVVGATGKVKATSSTDTTGENNESKFYVDIAELTENTTITADAKVVAKSGSVNNVATLSGDGIVKVEDSAAFTVKEAAPVSVDEPTPVLTKKVSKAEVNVGDKVTYTITASSDIELNDAVIKDTLPEGLTLLKDTIKSSSGTLTTSDQSFTVKCDKLKDTVTITYDAKVVKADSHKNTVSLEASNFSKGPVKAEATVKGIEVIKPELKKSADKKEVAVSGVVKYTVTASMKDGKVTDVSIKDTLPSGMELVKDSVKASDKGFVSTKDNVITVSYKNIEKKTVTITYEAKATKEGEQKNTVVMSYKNTDSDSKASELKAEATVKVTGEAGDSSADGKVDRAAYKTGDFIPYIVGAVLIALLVAAYVVYRRRNKDGFDE